MTTSYAASGQRHRLSPAEVVDLVQRAGRGEAPAWDALVDAYVALVWSITRGFRLSDGDAADVNQTTWLRLLENIQRLDDPSRVGAWLATTARRECLRVLRQSSRQVLVGDDVQFDVRDGAPDLDDDLLRAERRDEVRAALAQLPRRCQDLLALLVADPTPTYEEVSRRLGIPIGSLGPTRGRCLEKLRRILDGDGIPG